MQNQLHFYTHGKKQLNNVILIYIYRMIVYISEGAFPLSGWRLVWVWRETKQWCCEVHYPMCMMGTWMLYYLSLNCAQIFVHFSHILYFTRIYIIFMYLCILFYLNRLFCCSLELVWMIKCLGNRAGQQSPVAGWGPGPRAGADMREGQVHI